MRKKSHVAIIVTAIVVVVLLFIILLSKMIVNFLIGSGSAHENSAVTVSAQGTQILAGGNLSISLPITDYVGVVNVFGTIEPQTDTGAFGTAQGYQHIATMEYIDAMIWDDNNVGMVLNIDSPGGYTYEGEELYAKILEYKETTGRPIWSYMNHYGASAAYMIAMPSDHIYANINSMTGSIGVVISGYDLSGLYEKLGIRYISVTSGDNKDMSNPNDEQLNIYQQIVDESYERFVDIVAKGRQMSLERVKELADGRVYTATQAVNNGLIDKIDSYDQMIDDISEELGNVEFHQPTLMQSTWASLFSRIEKIIPKSEFQIATELSEQYEYGVPMYIAK